MIGIKFKLVALVCAVSFAYYVTGGDEIPLKISFLISTKEGRFFAGAFFRALDDINNNNSLLEGYKLDYLFNDTSNPLEAINAMATQHGNDAVGFIGPDTSCLCESTVAAAWNLPMIAYNCHDSNVESGKESYLTRTFARTQPATSKVSKSIVSILQHYEWKRMTLVVGASAKWNKTANDLMKLSELNNIYVNNVLYFKDPYVFTLEMVAIMYDIAEKSHTQTRIYVFLGDYHGLIDFVRILRSVTGENMSDYVVIAMDERLFTEDPNKYVLKAPFETEDTVEAFDIRSFETVLLLVPRPPLDKRWEPFLNDVRERNSKDPINGFPTNYNNIAKIRVPIYAAYLYDSVHTYALALDKVIKAGISPTNGTAIIDNIRNQTYTSILGYEVYVDKHGDAEGNYTLLTFEMEDKEEQIKIVHTGDFLMTHQGVGIPKLNLINEIKWKNGKPPLDSPPCGFDGEKCIEEFDWRIPAVCIVIATLVLIALGFGLRHYLYEQKLDRLLWKVDFKDITIVESVEDIIPTTRKKRRRSKSHPWKFMSFENEPERAKLLGDPKREKSISSDNIKRNLIGSYKGTSVSLKHILKKNIEIDRDLKKQLQLRKELNHENIARFVGACVDTPHIYILTQYCQRGSLQDILENSDISMDDMFVSSLVSDLIKAMIFIHDSEIGSHGNLKSSNCLVDSRWVLMVSDFGLQKLVNERSGSVTDLKKYYDKLLWKAPELLRNPNRDPAGTQKSDVYAFALILYEMFGRKGPWGDMGCSSREIVETVKQGSSSFRPNISHITCELFVHDCIVDCWQEDPEQRPDFKYIKFKLKTMLQGIKSNIFDNMISMMEKYANNLEELVAERTELLSEEKKMTENLLLRMLPRFVAERLKKGEPVTPEQYDSVTIFFSDIVGFTALSAESTPLEVVCMLNDLYTCFDAIVENYDVYKIETIGDAYFVVSGLPLSNGDLHAGEIASMALHMLRAIKTFKMRHRPDDTLKLRIGIHSGPCVAGVVGLKMPRYTLFGDTVNTASRMETTGIPLKIHCSSTVTALLTKLGGYHITERGYVQAKGKGEMLTYFLEGEDAAQRERRISKRVKTPTSPDESNIPLFGAATLHPKYWQNGAANNPHSLLLSPFSDTFQTCDEIKVICDKKVETAVTSQQSNGSLSNGKQRLQSNAVSTICNNTTNALSNPIISETANKDVNNVSLARTLSLNMPFSTGNNGFHSDNNNSYQESLDSIGCEKIPFIRKPGTYRQMSLPADIQEDTNV